MDVDDVRTIGWRLRRVRDERDKSLRVIAGLTGMSKAALSRIERGERSPTLNELVALADALQISVSELTRLPVPAPANGHTYRQHHQSDRARAGRNRRRPPRRAGTPRRLLRNRVARFRQHKQTCRFPGSRRLPGLIRDGHTTLAAGADHGELLELAVYLHVHVTSTWLILAAAPADLLRRVVFLARRLSQERGEVTTIGMAETLLNGGAFELGQVELDSLTLPPTTAATAGLVGTLTAVHSKAAALNGRPGEAAAVMDAAADMTDRFGELGETDPLGFEFGPTWSGSGGCVWPWMRVNRTVR